MRRLNLSITRANIKWGEQANPSKCPIANSIKDSIKNVTYVCVLPNEATIKVKRGKNILSYKSKMPAEGNNFVRNFDDGFKVTPFKLTLELSKLKKEIAALV